MDGSLPFEVQVALGDALIAARRRIVELEQQLCCGECRNLVTRAARDDEREACVQLVENAANLCTDCNGTGRALDMRYQCETCYGCGEFDWSRQEIAAAIRARKP